MKWFRTVLFKMFRTAIDQIIQDALEQAVTELHEDIDDAFTDEGKRESLKSGIALLRARLPLVIRERL